MSTEEVPVQTIAPHDMAVAMATGAADAAQIAIDKSENAEMAAEQAEQEAFDAKAETAKVRADMEAGFSSIAGILAGLTAAAEQAKAEPVKEAAAEPEPEETGPKAPTPREGPAGATPAPGKAKRKLQWRDGWGS